MCLKWHRGCRVDSAKEFGGFKLPDARQLTSCVLSRRHRPLFVRFRPLIEHQSGRCFESEELFLCTVFFYASPATRRCMLLLCEPWQTHRKTC